MNPYKRLTQFISAMAELTNKHFLATATLLIFLTTTVSHFHFTFSEDSKPTGFTLSLIPGDSPDSPLYQGNLTRHERMQRLINITQSKASLYRLMSSWPGNATTTPIGPENINLPMIRNNFYYAVKIGIGNPVYNAYLLLDTGSGLIWTQCEPCPTCYPMEYGIYDPRRSNTYSMLPSSHALCQSGYYKRVQNQCMYTMIYGAEAVAGGSTSTLPVPKTQGVASLETFTFANNEGGFSNIDGVIFGCSRYVQNFQDLMFNQKISGILGMNTAPDSLVTQLMNRIDKEILLLHTFCFGPDNSSYFGEFRDRRSENLHTSCQHTVCLSSSYSAILFGFARCECWNAPDRVSQRHFHS